MAKNGHFWDLGQKSFEIDTKLRDFGPRVAYLGGGTPQMDEKRRSPTRIGIFGHFWVPEAENPRKPFQIIQIPLLSV